MNFIVPTILIKIVQMQQIKTDRAPIVLTSLLLITLHNLYFPDASLRAMIVQSSGVSSV